MILARYIGMSLVKSWLLVTLVLGAVFGLIAFTEELDRVSDAYDTMAAARFTLLALPNQLVSLAPVIAILGSIVALANLDRYNELTIISCTGFSRTGLLAAVTLPTLGFMAVLWVCMEYITPQLEQTAMTEKNKLRYGDHGWIPDGGMWSTDGRRYIHLSRMSEDLVPGDIELFEFNETGELVRALRAESADVSKDRRWQFRNVREKAFDGERFVAARHDQLEISNLWSSDELPTLSIHGDSMSLSVLYNYATYRAANNQPWEKHLNTFWQKTADALYRRRHGPSGNTYQRQCHRGARPQLRYQHRYRRRCRYNLLSGRSNHFRPGPVIGLEHTAGSGPALGNHIPVRPGDVAPDALVDLEP